MFDVVHALLQAGAQCDYAAVRVRRASFHTTLPVSLLPLVMILMTRLAQ